MPDEAEDFSPDSFDFGDFSSDFGSEVTQPETPSVEQPQQQAEVSGSEGSDNPLWAPILDALPAEFHAAVKPKLKEWDQGVNAKFQEAADFRKQVEPYLPLVQQGINPQILAASLGLAQQLQQNPVALYEDLKNRLISEGRIQEAQQVQQKIDEVEDESSGTQDPYEQELNRLREQQRQMQEFIQQRAEQEEYQHHYAAAEQEIQRGFQEIEQKIGRPLVDGVKNRVLMEARSLEEQYGRPVSIPEAFVSLQKFVMTATQRKNAPQVLSPQGGHASPQAAKLDTEDDRKSAIAALIQGMNG